MFFFLLLKRYLPVEICVGQDFTFSGQVWAHGTILLCKHTWSICRPCVVSRLVHMPLKTARHPTPNKMAAKTSVPVSWPHILESACLPKSLVSRIIIQFFFFLLPTTVFWGSTDSESFISKLGKLILNFVEHSHTWEWKVVLAERVLKINLKKSTCLPYTSRSLL